MSFGRRLLAVAVVSLATVASCTDDTSDPNTEGGRTAFAYEVAVRNVLADEIARQTATTVVTVPPESGPSTTAGSNTTASTVSSATTVPSATSPASEVPTSVEIADPVVYLATADGAAIDPDVQVRVVQQLDDDDVDLRFADDRSEAIESDEPDEPVRENGVLIAAGPVPKEGSTFQFEFERYRSLNERETIVLSLHREGESWAVTSTTVLPSEP